MPHQPVIHGLVLVARRRLEVLVGARVHVESAGAAGDEHAATLHSVDDQIEDVALQEQRTEMNGCPRHQGRETRNQTIRSPSASSIQPEDCTATGKCSARPTATFAAARGEEGAVCPERSNLSNICYLIKFRIQTNSEF